MQLKALRDLPKQQCFKEGDVFVLFGELFGRGYANGLVEQARKCKMQIFGVTVGRRDSNKNLIPLSSEELAEVEKNLGGEVINIPLEAGFDLEKVAGVCPANLVDEVNKEEWKTAKLNQEIIEKCKQAGESKFEEKTAKLMEILYDKIPADKNIFFAHTMAGGFVRSKLLFVIANKIYKGKGDRHESSEIFWKSDLGQLCAKSFDSVTANTFDCLIETSTKIRERNEKNGAYVFYSAYGYHGTEVLIKDKFQWQTYVPYQQGTAKKRLENFAIEASKKGINATVFNCPEIRTNSSSIFLGVELPLFPLLKAMVKLYPSEWSKKQWQLCQAKLKENYKIEDILEELEDCLLSDEVKSCMSFDDWPTENALAFSNRIISLSEKVTSMHLDKKDLISDHLSQLILEAIGSIIFNYGSVAKEPVLWLGHEIVTKKLAEIHSL